MFQVDMLCQVSFAFLAIALVAGALLFFPVFKTYRSYCKRLAELEGRLEEFRSLSKDDSGLTGFEREAWAKIMNRYHLKFDDREFASMGDRLRNALIAAYGAGVVFLSASVFVGGRLCS